MPRICSFTVIVICILFTTTSPSYAQTYPDISWEYGTYYGGNDDDWGLTTAIDNKGNYCIAGYTESNNNIATVGSYLPVHSNGYGFLAYFNQSGIRKWGTHFQGIVQSAIFDNNGHIYFTGITPDSTIGTSGTHKDTLSGTYDAFIAKFDTLGNKVWCTYYGGNDVGGNYETGYKILLTNSNDILIVGMTYSSDNIATPNAHQKSYADSGDVFIAKFDTTGNIIWGTYYGGNAGESFDAFTTRRGSQPTATIDKFDNIYLTGTTRSLNNIATLGSFKSKLQTGNSNVDAFLAKFDKNGVRQWATYFGDSSYDYPNGITCDYDGNIYISGYTNSSSGIATAGAHRASIQNIGAFIAKFSNIGDLNWSTYYGDSMFNFIEHTLTNITFDNNRNLYLLTPYGKYISTPGSAGTTTKFYHGGISAFDTKGNKVWDKPIKANKSVGINGFYLHKSKFIIAGTTLADSFIVTLNAHQDSFGGSIQWPHWSFPSGDAFLHQYQINDTNVFIKDWFSTVVCSGLTHLVPYGVTRKFHSGNKFTVQLSDSNGSFSSPINIGSVSSDTDANIICTLPSNIVKGRNYKIRVIASLPADTSMERKLSVHDIPQSHVTLIGQPSDTICQGDTVTIQAVINAPIGTLGFSWVVNQKAIQLNSATYITDSLKQGDTVICYLSSTGNPFCTTSGINYTADTFVVTVLPSDTPSATITALPSANVPFGTDILFTAVPKGSGSFTYQWFKNNNIIAGSTTDTLQVNYGFWNSGDSITCLVHTNNQCATVDSAYSNTVVINYYGNVKDITSNTFNIYPNPNNGTFTITGNVDDEIVSITLINTLGQTVYKEEIRSHKRTLNETLSIPASVSNGIYTIKIVAGDDVETQSMVISR